MELYTVSGTLQFFWATVVKPTFRYSLASCSHKRPSGIQVAPVGGGTSLPKRRHSFEGFHIHEKQMFAFALIFC
jgi:hypothetical protein